MGSSESDATATLSTVLRWTLAAAGVALLVLFGSGLYLAFNYRPAGALAWANVQGVDHSSLPEWIRTAHRIAARVFVVLGVGAVVLAVVIAVRRRRVGAAIGGIGLLVATLGASFSGGLLAWDQVALWAVTVGADFKGFTKILSGDNVRSVIIGSKEISTGAFTMWFWVHTVVIPVVLIGLALAVIRATRRREEREVV